MVRQLLQAYFASGLSNFKGIAMTAVTTMIGVLCGWLMLEGAVALGGSEIAFSLTIGILVMCIVLMGQVKWTSFVPGMFVGFYSFFALRSPSTDWKILALSILAGILLGFICDWGGRMLFASWQPKKSKKKA